MCKENMPKMCYVIVDKKKGFGIYMCVKQANVAGPPAPVTSKLTAALAQAPAIKKELDTLCTSMCKINKITPEVQVFIQKKLLAVTLREKKGKKGRGENDLSDSMLAYEKS
jgi:hypothetical protein